MTYKSSIDDKISFDKASHGMLNLQIDAGTNSTNFSSIKDAANQEVKKDVSSLRYIALPNWAHDTLLDASSSKPHDESSTKVPEGSGNPNLTVSLSNPPADQMKTLMVESPIPTDSSPVLTACLNDSPEPSNEAIRVEADVSNMETTISASPTPTLRIYKDHPKSQIISPVDTLIQTRHKSKEVEEQSFIATIYQKTDPALLQFCLFSCFLSQVKPKKNVWTLVDCPKGVRPIGTKWVLKNKKDEKGIVVRNKARLVAQGHTQEEGIDYDKVFAPVAIIEAIRLFLAYASFMGFTDPAFPAKVYKVEKAMYGLHKDPRAWQREDFILVQVYVDDIIFGSSNPQLCREFEALIHEKIQMSAMSELNFFLGLQVLQKEDGIFLSQDKYLGDILKKFGYSDASSRCHLHAVKRIFQYLKGHPKLGLWYSKASSFDLVAYSDSDYGGVSQDHKSTTRGSQFLGRRLISWQWKKQTIVATSTTKAEYVAAASCCGQVL
nr:hypothetical protein [Tanacetum cinerariifolium]